MNYIIKISIYIIIFKGFLFVDIWGYLLEYVGMVKEVIVSFIKVLENYKYLNF